MRQPPTPSKSTHRIGRQSFCVTHFFREMLHSPALQLSCAQSESTRQVQQPWPSPSPTAHLPAHVPIERPVGITHVPPCGQSMSFMQSSELFVWHAGAAREHVHCVYTTMTSLQS